MILKTRDELSEYLSINPRTLDRWVTEGKLPTPIQPGGKGGKVFFDMDKVNEYLGRAIAAVPTNKDVH